MESLACRVRKNQPRAVNAKIIVPEDKSFQPEKASRNDAFLIKTSPVTVIKLKPIASKSIINLFLMLYSNALRIFFLRPCGSNSANW